MSIQSDLEIHTMGQFTSANRRSRNRQSHFNPEDRCIIRKLGCLSISLYQVETLIIDQGIIYNHAS